MLQLAFVLIGAKAFQARWYMVALAGVALIVLAAFVVFDDTAFVAALANGALALIFAGNGLLALLAFIAGRGGVRRYLTLARAVAFIVLGLLLLVSSAWGQVALAVLLGITLLVDGGTRFATAVVIRFNGWQPIIASCVVEFLLALMLFTGWPLGRDRAEPLCVALLLALSGWLILRFGLMFRTLEDEAAILNLPIFASRGWYNHAPVLVGDDPPPDPDQAPMVVHIWTPMGTADGGERRLVVDRYIAAVDRNGVMSTGHSSLEAPPHVYISHYPSEELDRAEGDWMSMIRSTSQNDVAGRFLPSYAVEVADWCPAEHHIRFTRYSMRRLRAFWVGYRQDSTYNLSDRNCSTVVVAALDAALEGSMASRHPWIALLRLLANPDLWVAAIFRARAAAGSWTPGFTLDYAYALARVVERPDLSWGSRLKGFLARRNRTEAPST